MPETVPPRSRAFRRLAAVLAAAASFVAPESRSAGEDLIIQLNAQPGARPAPDPTQPRDNANRERAFELSSGLTITPRRLLNALSRARTFIDQGLYADAVPLLQAVLDGEPDGGFRVTEGESGLLRNLRREAERIVGQLPLEGLLAYDLASGPIARQLLGEAAVDRDVDRLLETSRRFFHTDAGHEATYLLGILHLDNGRPFEAAVCFDRELQALDVSGRDGHLLLLQSAIAWSRAGMPEVAVARLDELRDQAPESEMRIGGRLVIVPDRDQDALEWLHRTIAPDAPTGDCPERAWPMSRGNAARTAAASGRVAGGQLAWSLPTSSWRVSNDETPFATGLLDVSRQIGGIERDYDKADLPSIPQLRPLIVRNRVIARTLTSLRAVDFNTGQLLWESARDDALDRVRRGDLPPLPGDRGSILDPLLDDRIYLNAAYGTLSANDDSVFCVEGLGLPADDVNPYNRNQRNHPLSSRTDSELSAFALDDGRTLWTVGGNTRTPGRELAGGYFLGPPLPIGGQLFGLAEFERRIVLYVIGAADGKLQWSKTLQEYELNVSQDPDRARAGLSPSFADGLLVCPTGSGVVVAVDPSTRQLVWSARYRPLTQGGPTNIARQLALARIAAQKGASPLLHDAPWIDALAMISSGRVILTPRDADNILCFDLRDGTLLWELPREDRLYVGGVRADALIVVGSDHVEQLSLDTGRSNGSPPVAIPRPSGWGLLNGDDLYLPLGTGEIAAIDLAAGRISSRIKLVDGVVPGNLVSAAAGVVMQGPTSVSRLVVPPNAGD